MCIYSCICICLSASLSVTAAAAAGCGRHFNELCSKRRVKNAKCIFARIPKTVPPSPLSSPWGTYSDYPRCCRLTASAYQLRGWKTLRNCAKLQTRFATGCRHCVGSRNDNGSGNPPESSQLRRTRPHVAVHCPTVARSGRSADCLPRLSPCLPCPLCHPLLGRQATQHLPPPQIISKCQKKNKPKQT